MLQKKVDALLVSSTSNITYLTGYSGFSQIEREAYLLIVAQPLGLTNKTPGVKGYLITDGRYTEAVKNIPNFTLVEINPTQPLKNSLIKLAKKHKIKKLGIEENNLTVSEYKMFKKYFNNIYHFSDIVTLRAVKDSDEITAIEKTCQLGDKAFDYILGKIKEGVTEKELAFEIEFFIKKNYADISFKPIVAFGKNSAIPHHQTSDKKLKMNNWVLLDFGVKIDNYCSDMTRTVFFGKTNNEQKKMYQTVLEAQRKAIESLTSDGGRTDSSEVDRVARDYIIYQGYPTIPHSLGHGIGLEVHETPSISPNSKDILKPGMVFSIEPGIYLPGIGGVRIEDLVVIENSNSRLLTKSPSLLTLLK